jgi:hypothetical protein
MQSDASGSQFPIERSTLQNIVQNSTDVFCHVAFVIRSKKMNENKNIFTISSRHIDNTETLESIARTKGCATTRLILQDMTIVEQIKIFQNITLLVSSDGTALLNTVFMNPLCSTILQVEMWRKPGIVKQLHRNSNWIKYRVPLNLTVWHDNYPLPVRSKCLNELPFESIDYLNLNNTCIFGNVILEDYLREGQSGSVDEHFFEQVILRSKLYYQQNSCSIRSMDSYFILQ